MKSWYNFVFWVTTRMSQRFKTNCVSCFFRKLYFFFQIQLKYRPERKAFCPETSGNSFQICIKLDIVHKFAAVVNSKKWLSRLSFFGKAFRSCLNHHQSKLQIMDRKKNIPLKQNASVFPIEQSQLKRKFFFSNLCCDEYRK